MEYKNWNKQLNIIKPKQTHLYKEQISGLNKLWGYIVSTGNIKNISVTLNGVYSIKILNHLYCTPETNIIL